MHMHMVTEKCKMENKYYRSIQSYHNTLKSTHRGKTKSHSYFHCSSSTMLRHWQNLRQAMNALYTI